MGGPVGRPAYVEGGAPSAAPGKPAGDALAAVTTGPEQDTDAYDAFGRLITEGTTSYTYDGLDRVTTRNAARFTYDGGSNNLTNDGTWTYARDAAGNLLGAANATSSVRLRTDQHTDVTATLDTNGTSVTGSTTYDPFGKPTATTGTGTSLGYQSGWTDPTTGDVNMAARWYRPGTGGFTSRDSYLLNPSPSVQANRYTYGNGSPLNGIDPTGHEVPKAGGGGGGGAGGGARPAPAPIAGQRAPANNNNQGIQFGEGQFEGSITIKPGQTAGKPRASQAYADELNTYTGKAPTNNRFTADYTNPSGYVGYYGATADGSYDLSEYWLEKREARQRARSNSSSSSSPQSPTGQPVADEWKPAGRGGSQSSGGGCTTCRRSTPPVRPAVFHPDPPKPPFDKTQAAVERPAPQLDWTPPNPQQALNVIAASYSSADLQAMLAVQQNVAPTVVAAATGPQPGTEPGEDRGRSGSDCRNGFGGGWRLYSPLDAGNGGRATGVEACLDKAFVETHNKGKDIATKPSGSNAVLPPGHVWAATFTWWLGHNDTSNWRNICHLLAGSLGGEGTAYENIASCSRTANSTPMGGSPDHHVDNMAHYEDLVRKAVNAGQVVHYWVTPKYAGGGVIPIGFQMKASGYSSTGGTELFFDNYVPNDMYSFLDMKWHNMGAYSPSGWVK
ncbi:RHS repeat-associated core domain-containing protein [Kitasatospora sp. NPDC086791]|uniref:RHS repeat-associated core domain-containing protein n=1 Tax=Kitasatospora sp. NPDC086791 TaxID=3155178 RepID=UPI003436A439